MLSVHRIATKSSLAMISGLLRHTRVGPGVVPGSRPPCWFSTAVGASLASGRHKVRMPVRLSDNETGGLAEAHRRALKASSELSVEWHKFWWDATVKEVDADKVLVGFDAWDSRWDEWIPVDSPRLRERLMNDDAMHTNGTIGSTPLQKPSVIERRPIVKVPEDGLPTGWEELRSDDGTPYYHNTATGLTQWDKPGLVDEASALPRGWKEFKADDGSSYYHNESTGVTQWERPGEDVVKSDDGTTHRSKVVTGGSEGEKPEESTAIGKGVPEGWQEFKTDDGTPYYYNESTGVTQWERAGAEETGRAEAVGEAVGEAERLPEGWEGFKADDGTPYYYCEGTGVTQWERPRSEAAAAGSVELPQGWQELKTDDGTPYYYNEGTGVTQWEMPKAGEARPEMVKSEAVREEGRLPEGWQELKSDDGIPYYYNEDTGQTQWERPLVVEGELKTDGLPEGWQEFKADDGTPYYYNEVTGVTQWERPDKAVGTEAVREKQQVPEGWEEFHADDGTPYYYNSINGQTQWEYPTVAHSEDSAASATEPSGAGKVDKKRLPDGWEELISDDGTPYYHHLATGATQWEVPTEVKETTVTRLMEGWEEFKTDDGVPYYYNSATDTTQWERPTPAQEDIPIEEAAPTAAEVAAAALKGLPDGWDCVLTPEGRELFFEAGQPGRAGTWLRP